MADRDKFQKTFDKLHASPEILSEVLNMTTENKRIPMKKTGLRVWKAATAMVACTAIAIVSVMSPWSNGANGNGSPFVLEVHATELTHENAAYFDPNDAEGWIFGDGDQEGDGQHAYYCINVPFDCTGEHIESITYSTNKGAFQIVEPKDNSIVTEYQDLGEEMNAGQVGGDDDLMGNSVSKVYYCTSYTVDYDKQKDEHTWINICDDVIVPNEVMEEVGDFNDTAKSAAAFLSMLMDGTEITCTVLFEDGHTHTETILVNAVASAYEDPQPEAVIKDKDGEILYIKFELK